MPSIRLDIVTAERAVYSEDVDMESIMESTKPFVIPSGADRGKTEAGELEVHFESGDRWEKPEPPAPEPGIVGERMSDEDIAKAREDELTARRGETPKKKGRPKKAK